MSHKPWTARLNRASISAAETGLKATHFRFVLALDEAARDKPFCWPSNQKLAEQLGVSEATIQRWSLEVEAQGGWICRVLTDRKRPDRIGFLMLRRLSDGMPACRTVEECHRVAAQIRDNWVRATNASGPVPIKILGVLPGERTQQSETPKPKTREIPRENDSPAPQEQGARHLRIEASGTSGLRSEELRISHDALQQQQERPVAAAGLGDGGKTPRPLTDAEAKAVAEVQAKAEATRPEHAPALVVVAHDEILAGRVGADPGQLVAMAEASLRPDATNPPGLFRSKIRSQASADGGSLRPRPAPVASIPLASPISPEEEERRRHRRALTLARQSKVLGSRMAKGGGE